MEAFYFPIMAYKPNLSSPSCKMENGTSDNRPVIST